MNNAAVPLYTPLFILRRMSFALFVCYMQGFTWVQLAFQFFCLITFASYLAAFRPFISKKQLGLELMNEIIEALLLYHLLTFSDWYTDDEMKETLAHSFNAVIFTNITIHLVFLFYTVFSETRS